MPWPREVSEVSGQPGTGPPRSVTTRSPLPSSLSVTLAPTRPSLPANAAAEARNGPTLPLATNMQW